MTATPTIRGPIGHSVERTRSRKLVVGRGRYTDDLRLPRMLHAAFVRSPYAHARIVAIDPARALAMAGVRHVFTGADIARVCTPWSGEAVHLPTLKSPPQHALAVEVAKWQGEPVAAVLADSRAEAEDAAAEVAVTWKELPAAADATQALAPGAALVHPALGTNLAFQHTIAKGEAEKAFAGAAHVVEAAFSFGRHTGVTLEPRSIIADYDPSLGTLTVHHACQAPFQMQHVFAMHLGIPEHLIRVICPDVGGGFGIKLHIYGDEVATCAMSKLVGRPVKFIADRIESLLTDIHARDHRVSARLALSSDGAIKAMELDDLCIIGAYANYRRFSSGEGMLILFFSGAPYRVANYRGRFRMPFQNKNTTGMYRGVGQPIACAVTEVLCDRAAAALGLDPVEFRRRNYLRGSDFPATSPGGMPMEKLEFERALDELVKLMRYPELRAEQRAERVKGTLRGIGLATFVEITAPGPHYYGPSRHGVSSNDGATVRLDPTGKVRVVSSVTDQGQGTETGIAQIVAGGLGVRYEDVSVIHSDTAASAYGGGAWGSRGTAIGGEAALLAATELKANVLKLAGTVLQADPGTLDLVDGQICNAGTGVVRMSLPELAALGYFRQNELPPDVQPEFAVTRSFNPKKMSAVASGIQAAYVEVDPDTGIVKLLHHWVVEDCGRLINPALVEEQIRGGVVQGLGAALFEHIVYDERGQNQTATLVDYLVPMAAEMPDITIGHIETPYESTMLGAKGAGEAGTVGAAAAVLNAVNDALSPLSAKPIAEIPITPDVVLKALGRIA
jgi:carbon-monoxide dehydrogenase large subunit